MVEFEIIYKFIFKEPEEEEDQRYYFNYLYELNGENYIQLTRKEIEEILKNDDVEIPKDIIIKYDLIKNDEKEEPIYKQFNGEKITDLNSKYKLYLNLEINDSNNINKIEEKEKVEEIQEQNAETKKILEELIEIRKQIKALKTQKNEDIKLIKKSANYNTMYIENDIKDNNKLNLKKSCNPQIKTSKSMENKSNNNIYFLYSSPINSYKDNYYFFSQYLNLYELMKKKFGIDINIRNIININTNQSYENPAIFHMRIDSKLDKDRIYFPSCQLYLDSFYNYFKNLKLKLLIISSDNIDKIKEQLDKLEYLKSVNKIYINHPNKPNYEFYSKENDFVNNLYNLLLKTNNIKDAYDKSISKIEQNEKDKLIQITLNEKNLKIFEDSKENKSKYIGKNILKYDMILNGYYPLIGRNDDFKQCLINLSNDYKITICGQDEEELKSFVKKLGFLFNELNSAYKIYFLEINKNEIVQKGRINKIDLLFDEIYQNNDEDPILLIIFFKDVENYQNLNEIKPENISRKKDIIIDFLYAFSYKEEIKEKDVYNLSEKMKYDEDEIKNYIYFFTKNKSDEIFNEIFKNVNNREDNLQNPENKPNIKIQNLYLLLIYMNIFLPNEQIENKKHNEMLKKIILKNDEDMIKEFLKEIVEKNKDLFYYLYFLKYGVGQGFLEKLMNISIQEIEKNFIGLMIIENNENEKIYRLNNSFREKIGEILKKEKIFDIIENILKNYYQAFREIKILDYNKFLTFNATINNKFWFTEKAEKENYINEDNKQLSFFFNEEIDSNNIYYIIDDFVKNIYGYNSEQFNQLFPYIEDISITLLTLLNYNRNDVYTDIMEKFFEEKILYNNQINDNIPKYNIEERRGLNIRLGIFKYWHSQKFEFYTKALEKNCKNKNDFEKLLNNETKIECCLINIYEHIQRRDKNIKEFEDDFYDYIKYIEKKDEFIIRFKVLRAQCLNSIKEIDELLNDKLKNKNYMNDLEIIRERILMHIAKFKFYFYLRNPLDTNNNIENIDISNNFFLIHKLLTIINKNYDVEFIPFKEKEDFNEIKNINDIEILFLYLGDKKLFNDLFNDDINSKRRIKVLVLGYFDENLKDNDFKEMHNKGIKNIIYIKKNEQFNYQSYSENFYFFEKIFFNFIHNFISFLVYDENTTIKNAFKNARNYFNRHYSYLSEEKNKPIIEIDMMDEFEKFKDGLFENENLDLENKENNNFIFDEYELEDENNKKDNVYYSENPFSKIIENEEKPKREIKNKKIIKLPGIESLRDFNKILNGNIYNKNKFRNLVDSIKQDEKFKLNGNINSQIVYDLCKYFYMEKLFKDGIYIIRQMGDKANLNKLIPKDNNSNNKSKSVLIVLDNLDALNYIISLDKKRKITFLICADDEKAFTYIEEEKEKELNQKYDFIKSYIDSIKINLID